MARLENGTCLPVTCSMGAAAAPAGTRVSVEALVAQAYAALYAAKRAGRDRCHPQGGHGLHMMCS